MGIGALRRYHGAPGEDSEFAVTPPAELPAAPAKNANAETWKAYARERGWDDSQSKADIVKQFDADRALHVDAGSERQAAGGGTEIVPEGIVTASEPEQSGGEGDNRQPGEVGEGVTGSTDLVVGAPTESES